MEEIVVVVTAEYVPGYRIVKTLGPAFGIVVRSRGIGGNILAGLRSLAGGEIHEYTKMLTDARLEAVQRLMNSAKLHGANAVIGMKFDSSEMGQVMTEILAYGTAVVIEKEIRTAEPVSLR